MSEYVRELNKKIDLTCAKLTRDHDRYSELALEESRLREQLATVVNEMDSLKIIINCRTRDMNIIMNQLPLTQASQESNQSISSHSSPELRSNDDETDEDDFLHFLTQATSSST